MNDFHILGSSPQLKTYEPTVESPGGKLDNPTTSTNLPSGKLPSDIQSPSAREPFAWNDSVGLLAIQESSNQNELLTKLSSQLENVELRAAKKIIKNLSASHQ